MTFMKKQQFLTVDYITTVKLTPVEKRTISKWLSIAGLVLQELFNDKIIPVKGVAELHVSLLICGDSRIRQLNLEHRGKDKVTDVLSFPAHEDLRKKNATMPVLFLGDLAICHHQTRRQAREFSITYFDEFIHLFFHGIIHLLGFDHEVNIREQKLMEKWEKEALDRFTEIKKKGAN